MKLALLAAFCFATLSAQPLPAVRMQWSPDQIFRSLRDKTPVMPKADCDALSLNECRPDDPMRIKDISLRWVHLDYGPELEAILITEAPEEFTGYAAFVFHRQGGWNLVGSFFAREDDGNGLIRVQKLIFDAPKFLLCYRYLGGMGNPAFETQVFQLREGKLWPVIEFTNYLEFLFLPHCSDRQIVYESIGSDDMPSRLVIHSIHEAPPGKVVQNKCEVLRWSPQDHKFVPAKEEQNKLCDSRTGIPIEGQSHLTGIAVHP